MTSAEITLVLLGIAALTDRIMRLLEYLEGKHHDQTRTGRRAAR